MVYVEVINGWKPSLTRFHFESEPSAFYYLLFFPDALVQAGHLRRFFGT